MSDKDIEQVARDYSLRGTGSDAHWRAYKMQAIAAVTSLKSLGWLSPADATAMAQAAQADMKERAAKVADEFFSYFEEMVIGDPGSEIRALTPSSVPWQRVQEGSVVVPNEPTDKQMEEGMKALHSYHRNYGDDLKAAYRAMLAEVKK